MSQEDRVFTVNAGKLKVPSVLPWEHGRFGSTSLKVGDFKAVSTTPDAEKGPYIIYGPDSVSWRWLGQPLTVEDAHYTLILLNKVYNAGIESERNRICNVLGV